MVIDWNVAKKEIKNARLYRHILYRHMYIYKYPRLENYNNI